MFYRYLEPNVALGVWLKILPPPLAGVWNGSGASLRHAGWTQLAGPLCNFAWGGGRVFDVGGPWEPNGDGKMAKAWVEVDLRQASFSPSFLSRG